MSDSEKTRIINVSTMAQTPVAQTQSVDLLWQVKFCAARNQSKQLKAGWDKNYYPPGRELRCVGLATDPATGKD
jgi:hypothetical protein